MILWLILGLWVNFPFTNWRGSASPLILFLLILLLGLAQFGAPLH